MRLEAVSGLHLAVVDLGVESGTLSIEPFTTVRSGLIPALLRTSEQTNDILLFNHSVSSYHAFEAQRFNPSTKEDISLSRDISRANSGFFQFSIAEILRIFFFTSQRKRCNL